MPRATTRHFRAPDILAGSGKGINAVWSLIDTQAIAAQTAD
jgi:hypothetical protein